jgi:predicted membrane GTPase involved in stress response
VVTNRTPWEIPNKPSTYENYVERRQAILTRLRDGLTVREVALQCERKERSIYQDIQKIQNETGTETIWGALLEAMRRGWIECVVQRPHVHTEESNETPTVPRGIPVREILGETPVDPGSGPVGA